jgi:hypothetical protein
MTYRNKFEIEIDRLAAVSKEIAAQQEMLGSAYGALQKLFEEGVVAPLTRLEKVATGVPNKRLSTCHDSLSKCSDLIAKVQVAQENLKRLCAEYSKVTQRCEAALPSWLQFASEARIDVPPSRTFFLANKDASAGASRLELPAQKQSKVDVNRSLFDTALSHRPRREQP